MGALSKAVLFCEEWCGSVFAVEDTRMFELLSFFHPFLYECATGIGYIGALGL